MSSSIELVTKLVFWYYTLQTTIFAQNGEPSSVNDDEVVLTPSCDLRFHPGEMVTLYCGHRNSDYRPVDITWITQAGTVAEGSTDRISATEENKGQKATAFKVLTLKVADLQLKDSGIYTCTVKHQQGNGSEDGHEKNLSITVTDSVCAFEGEDLCGWTVGNDTELQWNRYQGSDKAVIDSPTGPRYDHTYGAVSDNGHFMVVYNDRQLQSASYASARLVSPEFQSDSQKQCLAIWLRFDGHGSS